MKWAFVALALSAPAQAWEPNWFKIQQVGNGSTQTVFVGSRPADTERSATMAARFHDREKGVTCWMVWEVQGAGLALSCLPDHQLRK
jgi:hypothetical protein